MGPIISIFRDVNSESPNIEMHYLCFYFRDQNRELLEYDFCSKISIYRDRVKNRVLLEMLVMSHGARDYTRTLYLFFQTWVIPSLITVSKCHI